MSAKPLPQAIAINGRFLTQRITGVQRHAIETVRALDALLVERPVAQRPDVELIVPPGQDWTHGPLSAIRVRPAGRRSGHLWEQLFLPFIAGERMLLNLCNTYPLFARQAVVTVHDAAVYAMPGGYTVSFVRAYRLLFAALKLRRRIRVLTDSAFSAAELSRHVGLPPPRLNVVHCGADHWRRVQPDSSILTRLGLEPGSYVLGVASENPNKNLLRLVSAFDRAFGSGTPPDGQTQPRLVLVGGRNTRVFSGNSALPDPPWMVRAGPVSDAELASLYASANCFSFPSLYEGFGLPPLEAMSFGCPVLVSREASLPEVCGEAAIYCDGRDEADIALKLATLVGDEALRGRLIAAGFERVTHFTWRATARQVLEHIGAAAA